MLNDFDDRISKGLIIHEDGSESLLPGYFAPGYILHIYPGSFDPLHDGHKEIFDSIKTDGSHEYKFYEISTKRFGKNNLSEFDILDRAKQFDYYAKLLVTDKSLFIDKLSLIKRHNPGVQIIFHIGDDTFVRLTQHHAPRVLENLDCGFVVYPRSLEKLQEMKYLCDNKECFGNYYASNFMINLQTRKYYHLSSTKIRNGL
jgi:nicotinic acid mononucleotide adenylyltransferase